MNFAPVFSKKTIKNFIYELFEYSTLNLGALIANQRDVEISFMLSLQQLCLIDKDSLP